MRFWKLIVFSTIAICIGFINQPAVAQNYDQSAHAKWTANLVNQGFGAALDPLGQFCRGMQAAGPILEKHPILKFPPFALVVAIKKGADYTISLPEQYASRVATLGGYGQVGLWETAPLAKWAADNPYYTGVKYGLFAGFVAPLAIEGLEGFSLFDSYLILVPSSIAGATAVNAGADWALKANW